MRKLPVFRSVKEVYAGVTRHYLDLLISAPLAIAAYACALLIFSYVNGSVVEPDMPQMKAGAAVIAAWKVHILPISASVILVAASVLASAVRWHRFVLLGERHRRGWGKYENGYFWSSLKIGFSMIGIVIVLVMLVSFSIMISKSDGGLASGMKWLGFGVVTLGYLWMFMFTARVSLALPDVALGGSGGIREAWERTKGNSWRLLGYWILVQLPIALVAAIVYEIVMAVVGSYFEFSTAYVLAAVINLPVSIYTLMIGVTMLSVAYREIIGLPVHPGSAYAETGSAERIEPA